MLQEVTMTSAEYFVIFQVWLHIVLIVYAFQNMNKCLFSTGNQFAVSVCQLFITGNLLFISIPGSLPRSQLKQKAVLALEERRLQRRFSGEQVEGNKPAGHDLKTMLSGVFFVILGCPCPTLQLYSTFYILSFSIWAVCSFYYSIGSFLCRHCKI